MTKRVLAPWCVLSAVLLLCVAWLPAEPAASQPTDPNFTAEAYLAHVRFLADDQLEGRQPGTPGIEQAAEYIANQFKAAGLKAGGDGGTYFQQFEVRRGKKLVDAEAELSVDGPDAKWQFRQDWISLPFADEADITAPLAFAGYGIDALLHDYSDYKDFDATGKVLLIFRSEPQAGDPNADFGGQDPSRYAMFNVKAQTAARHGAKAILFVNPPRTGMDDTLYKFDEDLSYRSFDVPLVQITRPVAAALLKQAGLPTMEELHEKLRPEQPGLSADMKLTVHLKTGVRPNLIPTRNVIGLLPGTGDTEETIVVGGHYDHLGKVARQFQRDDNTPVIHNGADDNASGTAAVIELARVLGKEDHLRRNVVFIAFSGEEMGLLGSKHYIESLHLEDNGEVARAGERSTRDGAQAGEGAVVRPVAHSTDADATAKKPPADKAPVNHSSVRAMVNFDMVGRLKLDKFTVFGVPSAPEFADVVQRAADHAGLKYRAAPGVAGNSDHAGFYYAHIPVLFAFTGVHKEYHRPEDDWQLIDAEGAARILGMFSEVIRDLANMEVGPTYRRVDAAPEPEDEEMKPGVEHEKDKEKAAGAHGGDGKKGEVEQPSMPKVRLGIVPDYSGARDEAGMVIDTVMDNGPAKAAGLKDGDRIVRIGDQKVTDVYTYMQALGAFKGGESIDVVIVRDGKEQTIKVTLKAAPKPKGSD
jgi:hypothetical protein